MCQFMLSTIPSFIQHRIPQFLSSYVFVNFAKFTSIFERKSWNSTKSDERFVVPW